MLNSVCVFIKSVGHCVWSFRVSIRSWWAFCHPCFVKRYVT